MDSSGSSIRRARGARSTGVEARGKCEIRSAIWDTVKVEAKQRWPAFQRFLSASRSVSGVRSISLSISLYVLQGFCVQDW